MNARTIPSVAVPPSRLRRQFGQGAQLIGIDMVTADAAAAKLFGFEPRDITHVRLAAEQGLGRIDVDKLKVENVSI